MTALSNAAQAYNIKLGKSKKLLDAAIERHNSQHAGDLTKQLRASHRNLVEKLIYLYSLELHKTQYYGGPLNPQEPLPLLRTNNSQLANMMGCTPRTVINLLQRLKAAKIITERRWHGTNTSYALQLSLAVLYLEAAGRHPDNVIHLFSAAGQAALAQGGVKTFPHTVTSTKQVTNKLNKLSGADFQVFVENSGLGGQSENPQPDFQVFVENSGLGGQSENPQPGSGPVTQLDTLETGYEQAAHRQVTPPPIAAPPPAAADAPQPLGLGSRLREKWRITPTAITPVAPDPSPAPAIDLVEDNTSSSPVPAPAAVVLTTEPPSTFAQVVSGLAAGLAQRILLQVQCIYAFAMAELYADRWIDDAEAERARALIAEYIVAVQPQHYVEAGAQVMERITLVARWIERGRQKGQKRFVPLPSIFFDHRNPKGFAITKAWYLKHKLALHEMNAKAQITKAVRAYQRSLEPRGQGKDSPIEAYRKITQALGKKDRALLDRFHEQINAITHDRNNDTAKATTKGL